MGVLINAKEGGRIGTYEEQERMSFFVKNHVNPAFEVHLFLPTTSVFLVAPLSEILELAKFDEIVDLKPVFMERGSRAWCSCGKILPPVAPELWQGCC